MERLRVFLWVGPAEDLWANALNGWVAAFKRRLKGNPIRWIPSESLHITLRFFGSDSREDVVRITERVAPIVSLHETFVLQTAGLALFPNPKRARVAAVELTDPTGALFRLEEEIRRETGGFGQGPEDRKFRAHVTFGRIRESKNLAEVWSGVEGPNLPPWPVREVKLFMSETSAEGSVYTPLAVFPLVAGA